MSREPIDTYFETVQLPGGQVQFTSCDGQGESKNSYLTLLESTRSISGLDFHMSFNVRDSMLFLAVNDDGKDVGFSIPVNHAALQVLGHKLLALSAQTTSN